MALIGDHDRRHSQLLSTRAIKPVTHPSGGLFSSLLGGPRRTRTADTLLVRQVL